MKIRTNLFLLAATFVVLITLTGFIMFNTFGRINREIHESNRASRIIKDISELDIVTYEYLMHHEKRMQQQWQLKYDSLGKILERVRKEEIHPESIPLIESMIEDYKLLGDLDSQLQTSFAERERLIEENKPEAEINIILAFEERLIAEVLMRANKITAQAFKLSAMIEQIVVQTQQRSNLIIIFSIIGFAIFSSYILFLTIRAITKPINELIKGAEIIGKGDLKHKIDLRTKNEMAQLANSFNKMTKDLQEITVSRDKLDKEVTERKKAEKRIEHLNLVLHAIRSVNQLIVREKDRDRLIQDACKNFIMNRGFYSAWIALVDESRRVVTAAEAGLGKAFQPLLKNLKQGNLPNCMRRVLAKPDILAIKDPASACGGCPLANTFKENGILSSRLEHNGKIYGILTVSLPVDYISVKEECSLFEEVVDDVAYALCHIELEEEGKKAEELLKKLSSAIEQTVDHVIITDKEGVIEYVNPSFEKLTGYTKEEAIGKTPRILKSGKHGTRFYEELWEMILSGKFFRDVFINKKKGGELFYDEKTITPIKDAQGYITHFISTGRDITERKRAEDHIRASLKEKEILLQEVHHRVKNNMQIISSLFNLQSRHIKDKQAFEIFKSSQNRVRSMAIIHERLYQSKDMARVDFAEYAQNLSSHLFSSHGINPGAVKLNLKIKDVFLDLNTAIPCGLIINELVSNSLKHAFPGEKNGEIKIAMHPLNKDGMEVIVSDNGVGLPKKVDFRNAESLGLHLVNLLAEDQLHGDIKLDRKKGTSFHIRFKVKR